MLHASPFILDFMKKYSYPAEAVTLFTKVLTRLDDDPDFARRFDALRESYLAGTVFDDKILNPLHLLATSYAYSPYTMDFVFWLSLTEDLKERYAAAGISERVYWETMSDLRCKLLECIECKGVPGTFTNWADGFFRMQRFAYGRFQYELATFNWHYGVVMRSGFLVRPGDTYVNFHIPSSGVPLIDEVRFASYREAYKHYVDLFPEGKVLFGCSSWLLFPRHREFLPERMNIRSFIEDFELISWSESEKFDNAWRVFGKYADLPPEKLPRDTTLRRAYADWLAAGHKSGSGFGLFLFDGEKIVM